ncbi:MAG: MotA/TolQ/ExbB proton channel family protein [Paludibaculum sp.]
MDWLLGFIGNYLRQWPFFVLHLATWGIAFKLIWERRLTARDVDPEAAATETGGLTPGQVANRVKQLARYEEYLDLTSSAFVFVGLVGTIAGFTMAFTRGSGQLNLAVLAQALSTSAFGICWSLVLNVVSSFLHNRDVAPVLDHLHSAEKYVDLDATAAAADERNRQFMESLSTTFASLLAYQIQEPFKDLSKSIHELESAAAAVQRSADSMQTAATSSTTKYRAAENEMRALMRSVSVLIEKAAQLPELVLTQTEKATESFLSAFSESMTNIAIAQDALGTAIVKRLGDEHAGLVSEMTAAVELLQAPLKELRALPEANRISLEGTLDAYNEYLADFAAQQRTAAAQAAEACRQEFERPLAQFDQQMQRVLGGAEETFGKTIKTLSKRTDPLLPAMRESMAEATRAALKEYQTFLKSVGGTLAEDRSAMVQLGSAMRELVTEVEALRGDLGRRATASEIQALEWLEQQAKLRIVTVIRLWVEQREAAEPAAGTRSVRS